MLVVACAATPNGGNTAKLALVIGNAAYENAPPLLAPVNDAADMCTALGKLGFKTLCHTNVRDRAEFDARVKDYVDQLGPNSVGVVYYSGHGVQVRSANFLIPTQVSPKTASEDPLRVLYGVDDLFDRLRQKTARFQLVILDACRTDILAPASRQPSGDVANSAARSNLVRSLGTVAGASNGFAPIQDAPPETLVLYATAARGAAFDGEGRNSPLTKHILRHIGTRGLSITEFTTLVTSGVVSETTREYSNRQTPFTYGSLSDKFCLAGCETVWPPPAM